MKEQEPIVMDMNFCVDYIAKTCGIDKATVTAVLDAETEYMRELGIIEPFEEE